MGLKAGVPDLVVFKQGEEAFASPIDEQEQLYSPAPVLWLELKAKAGSLSAVQKDVHAHLKALGHRVAVVRTLDEVVAELAEFVFPEKLRARVSL
jgi:ABC-type branched-subunit amino acid transport system ATPase component